MEVESIVVAGGILVLVILVLKVLGSIISAVLTAAILLVVVYFLSANDIIVPKSIQQDMDRIISSQTKSASKKIDSVDVVEEVKKIIK